jgi:predicted small lipoprotein YifL
MVWRDLGGARFGPAGLVFQGRRVAWMDRRLASKAVLVGALAAVVALSACGRKGPLEAPPAAGIVDKDAAKLAPDGTAKPDKPFALDPLLK